MKKSLLFILAFFAFSFSVDAQISYGVGAGLNLGHLTNFRVDDKEYQKPLPSFYLSAYADYGLSSLFSIQAGLSLQGKGHKLALSEDGAHYQETVSLMSLELPVNAVVHFPTKVGNVFVGAGPYVGYYLSGNYKAKLTGAGEDDYTDSEKIHFSGDDKDLKPFEAGLNAVLGFKLNQGYLINVGYGLGLTQMNTVADSKTMSARILRFGIGYQF